MLFRRSLFNQRPYMRDAVVSYSFGLRALTHRKHVEAKCRRNRQLITFRQVECFLVASTIVLLPSCSTCYNSSSLLGRRSACRRRLSFAERTKIRSMRTVARKRQQCRSSVLLGYRGRSLNLSRTADHRGSVQLPQRRLETTKDG